MVLAVHAKSSVITIIRTHLNVQHLYSTEHGIIGNRYMSCFLSCILSEKFTWKMVLDHVQVQLRKCAC